MVIGQLGESFGLLLFDSEDELEQFGSAMEAMEEGGQPDVPPYLVLNFERGAELAPGLRREIAVNHWEVASVDAYPVLLSMQPGMLSRPATARELAVMEVVALALPMLLDDVEALQEAWGGGDDSICSMCVDGYGGEFDVVIGTCPSDGEDDPEDELSGAELMDILADIASDAEERGDDRREARQHYEDLLLAPFYEGAEGLSHDAGRWSRMLFDILAQPGGVPLPKLYPAALEDALFRDLPKQADLLIDDADDIVDELRGVFLFLACVTDHATAGACADVLRNPAAADRLRLAITQRRRARATRTQGTRGKGTESGKGKGKGEGGGKR